MKIRIVNIAEIALYLIFIVASIITRLQIARLGYVALPAFLALGSLYFPLGIYTIRSTQINAVYAVLYVILFSLSLTALFSRILKSSFTVPLLLVFIILFLTVALLCIFSGSFSKGATRKIIQWDTPTLVRYTALLITMIV